jgi:RNA polymerase sigma factor (sigma-70 family)
VVAFDRRRTFRTDSTSARPWLLGIATNLLHDRRRRDRRELDTMQRVRDEPRLHREHPDLEPLDPALAQALAGLDPGQRDVLLLYAWAELSYEEIAVALGVPIGTVRSRLARARAHLRTHLPAPPTPPRRNR